MKKIPLRRKFAIAGAVFVLLLLIGYVRLPAAAIAGLADYPLIAGKPAFYGNTDVSPIQRLWLKGRIPCLGAGTTAPSINVSVRWNRLFVARVHSGLHVGPMAAEGR
ncbi:MAG: hypothetical protein GY851_24285, partial [bacterium]|nr:hypothetical protein [bacterium]